MYCIMSSKDKVNVEIWVILIAMPKSLNVLEVLSMLKELREWKAENWHYSWTLIREAIAYMH